MTPPPKWNKKRRPATQRLYWSNISAYRKCPQRFLWGRGWPTIDQGRGLGKRKKPQFKRSEHHALMGTVIAEVFERLYNDELWRQGKELPFILEDLTDRVFEQELPKRYISYSGMKWQIAPSNPEMLQICKQGILGYIQTMKANKLLGPYARSEVDLASKLDRWLPTGGKVDLLLRREDTGVTILDGKNSGKIGNPDPDQLLWYAMCFYLAYGKLPDRLLFAYYRFPVGTPREDLKFSDPKTVPPETWNGLVEVPFTVDSIRGIAAEARKTYRAMEREQFDPTPSPDNCRFCDFENECPARAAQKKANRKKPSTKAEIAIDEASGFVDL